MADYAFLTIWTFDLPIGRVWEAIDHPLEWPRWWDGLSVEQLSEDLRRFTLRAPFGYSLSFEMRQTLREPPTRSGGDATGDLAGAGLWELEAIDGGTVVRYTWRVRTTKRWMNLLAPLARPLFARNHAIAMRRAGEGLARHLGGQLVTQRHEAI